LVEGTLHRGKKTFGISQIKDDLRSRLEQNHRIETNKANFGESLKNHLTELIDNVTELVRTAAENGDGGSVQQRTSWNKIGANRVFL
jgi:hypothetical protein